MRTTQTWKTTKSSHMETQMSIYVIPLIVFHQNIRENQEWQFSLSYLPRCNPTGLLDGTHVDSSYKGEHKCN